MEGKLPAWKMYVLYLSILVNIGAFWYIVSMVAKNVELEQDIVSIVEKIEDFSNHIEEIHGLEMYYGDENLQNMIRHSKELINDIIDFQLKYFDTEEDFEPDSEEETQEAEEQLLYEDS